MKVIIVGGGIGGLATALMCHARGLPCEVYEQASDIREVGVGINLLPHAVAKLKDLGLLPNLDEAGVRTEELIYTNRFGQEIWREKRGMAADYEVPQFSIHRGRLQGVLLRAVTQRLGNVVHTAHRLVNLRQDERGVNADFETGGGPVSVEASVMIAADGIHSVTRKLLFPPERLPRWNGVMIWRGATDWPVFLTGRSMIVAGGMKEKIVVYPIAAGSSPRKSLTNWAVNVRIAEDGAPLPQKEDWSRLGQREQLMRYVDRFQMPLVDIEGLVGHTREFWEYPMCDQDPLSSWSIGHVTLLGDAAHPMYPVGSNGAGQAILDAESLSRHLAGASDPVDALMAYQAERLPPTSEIVGLNRQGGPENVIDEVEKLSPKGFARIDDVLSFEKRRAIVNRYASVAGFSRAQVNLQSSNGTA
jgi:2-polyprenyl-6-methoxyphenol hydroxylase-like FAD-dependent oxidoreductase